MQHAVNPSSPFDIVLRRNINLTLKMVFFGVFFVVSISLYVPASQERRAGARWLSVNENEINGKQVAAWKGWLPRLCERPRPPPQLLSTLTEKWSFGTL